MKKIIAIFALSMTTLTATANIGWFRKGWWEVRGIPGGLQQPACKMDQNVGQFWLHKYTPTNDTYPNGHGTCSDEGAGVALMARYGMIVESNGGNYGMVFCPTQIQGSNRNKKHPTWVTYFAPTSNGAGDGCVWMCVPGRSGEFCRNKAEQTDPCDKRIMSAEELRKRFTLKTSGCWTESNGTPSVESTDWMIGRFPNTSNCGGPGSEIEIIYGATEFLANGRGIIGQPIAVTAYGDGSWVNKNTGITAVGGFASKATFCMPGYAGAGCAESSLLCQVDKVCSGVDLKKLVAGTHLLGINQRDKCSFVKCADVSKCMTDDYKCVDIKNPGFEGPSPLTGKCMTCSGSNIFDASSPEGCVAANLIPKNDVKKCYLTFTLDEFRNCLKGELPATQE